MTDNTATHKMLSKHHRNGENFAQLMKDTFASRFNAGFWQYWQSKIQPAIPSDAVVVDVGTGPGSFLVELGQRYPDFTLYGVEYARYMLDAMEDLPQNASMLTADLHDPKLPLENNSVDVVVASVVIHEMHQPIKTFAEMYRCLKPGGFFYILDWVRAPLSRYLENTELAVFDAQTRADQLEDLFVHFIEHNRFTLEDLEFMLKQTGFELVESELLNDGRQAKLLLAKT